MDNATTNPFACYVPYAEAQSSLLKPQTKSDEETLFPRPELDINAIRLDNPYALNAPISASLSLPELEPLGLESGEHAIPPLASDAADSLTSTPSFDDLQLQPLPPLFASSSHRQFADTENYPWELAAESPSLRNETKFLTWETLLKGQTAAQRRRATVRQSSVASCVTEVTPAIFDAALETLAEEKGCKPGKSVRWEVLLRCLWQAGLGRTSALFCYDNTRGRFVQSLDGTKAPGCSLESTQSLTKWFLSIGDATLGLRAFIASTYSEHNVSSTFAALSSGLDVVLGVIEEHVLGKVGQARSLLQLQDLFEPVSALLNHLKPLVQDVRPSSTNEDTLNELFDYVQATDWAEDTSPNSVMRGLLTRAARSWFESVEQWIGLSPGNRMLRVRALDGDSHSGRPTLPKFVTEHDTRLICETKGCLDFLRSHHPNLDTLQGTTTLRNPPKLEWEMDLNDIERINAKTIRYQEELSLALHSRQSGGDFALSTKETQDVSNEGTVHEDPADLVAAFNMTTIKFALPLSSSTGLLEHLDDFDEQQLRALATSCLRFSPMPDAPLAPTLQPPLTLALSLSLSPLLRTQHQLYAHASLHFLLHNPAPSLRLQTHLALHNTFSLFSSESYTSKYPSLLAFTLFSDNLATSERFKGQPRTGAPMGLRLGTGTRRDWPPASSELQLALGDVLGQAWRYREANDLSLRSRLLPSGVRHAALPGGLAFTLRTEIPEEEIEKILDSNSIHALDFLKLGYTAPPHLKFLFNRKTLDRYDAIFGLQLKLLRVRFALSNMNSARERQRQQPQTIEARTAVNALSLYFLHQAIAAPWSSLQQSVASLEETCRDPWPDFSATPAEGREISSLDALAHTHAETLDNIAANLLLRKKQVRAREAMEAWLQSCLDLCSQSANGTAKTSLDGFDAKLQAFKSALRSLANDARECQKQGGDDLREERDGAKRVLEVFEAICGI
ncbi:MAG: hypothetical protein M1828_001179 [Chrysothrix sp. TS-e1954]|nr:MAG: hypothetical protein M1828_001179 [Chrysothrix sp. TS-e1954]